MRIRALLALGLVASACDQPTPAEVTGIETQIEVQRALTARESAVLAAVRDAAERIAPSATSEVAGSSMAVELRAVADLLQQLRVGEAQARVQTLRGQIDQLEAAGGIAAELDALRLALAGVELLTESNQPIPQNSRSIR